MNRSKIEYCDHTLNIITGCQHGCPYCYAEQMAKRFCGDVRSNRRKTSKFRKEDGPFHDNLYILDEPFIGDNGKQIVYPFGFAPTYHRYRYKNLEKLKMGCNIFVGAMADVFGWWVPEHWIRELFDACEEYPQHNYLFLTKNPERYNDYKVPERDNFWYGTTVTNKKDLQRIYDLPESVRTFVSIEPLHEDLGEDLGSHLWFVDWVIIGAETGKRKGKIVPELEWVKRIVNEADYKGIPVFMKDSMIPIVGETNMRRDYPKELTEKRRSAGFAKKMETSCMICGKTQDKHDMANIMVRVERRGTVKTIAAMCRPCYTEWCRNSDITSYEEELWARDAKH